MWRAHCVRVCLPRREAGVCTGPRCSALRWRLRVLCGGEGHVHRPWLRRGGGAPALAAERWWRFLRAMPPPPPLRLTHHRALGLISSAGFLLWQGILQQQGILLWQGIPHMAGHPAPGRASRTRQGIPHQAGHPAPGRALGDLVGVGGRCVVQCCAVLCCVVCCTASAERAGSGCGLALGQEGKGGRAGLGCGLVLGQEGRRERGLDRVMGLF